MEGCYVPQLQPDAKDSINLDDSVKRRDGRNMHDLRSVYMKTNVVSQALGSAYVELGATKVLASV